MNSEQQALSTQSARNLAHTTKTVPYMVGLTPQNLLRLLPWENVSGGIYQINRTKVVMQMADQVSINTTGTAPSVTGEALRAIPMFSLLQDDLLNAIASHMTLEQHERGDELVKEGEDRNKFYTIVDGNLELVAAGEHGNELRIRFLQVGNFFGVEELLAEQAFSMFTVRTLTDTSVLAISRSDLDAVLESDSTLMAHFQEAKAEIEALKTRVNEYGEANVEVRSDHEGEVQLPSTYIDYSSPPKEFPLSMVQTVLKVHTRVSDLYNDPMNQLQQQLRLTITNMKERQEWELVNNPKFGLLAQCESFMRVPTRYGAPTPDDLDTLLSMVWKSPSFFLAHPRAIMAFARECTWRGVPPPTIEMMGQKLITWRGVPLIPSDKVEIDGSSFSLNGAGKTKIILVRTGKETQGVIGLHQVGIPGEISPGLSVRQMGIDEQAITSYLLTQYYSLAALIEDAIAVLDNVEVGHFHDYANRPKVK